MATKREFLEAYERELRAVYAWARDPAQLAKFMASVRATLDGGNTWSRSGHAYEAALRACGLPKRTTLKALWGLTDG